MFYKDNVKNYPFLMFGILPFPFLFFIMITYLVQISLLNFKTSVHVTLLGWKPFWLIVTMG